MTPNKLKKVKGENPTPQTFTAKEVKEIGRIVYDIFDGGLRFIVMRGPYHWCGYMGVPKDHPLAGFDYNDLPSINAHGGLTFSSEARGNWPEGYWWYGWDYGHLGDYSHFEKMPERLERGDKDWTIEEVIKDSQETLCDFKELMKFVEKIILKTK